MEKYRSSKGSRGVWIFVLLALALLIYFALGAYAASRWMKPRRDTEFVARPSAFNLEYRDVTVPSRDAGIQLSGWWIPRAGSTKAIVMVHGRGENRTTEFYDHFLDLGAALHGFQGRGFNVLMIDLRAHGLSGGDICGWGVAERRDVEGSVDWVKAQGFRPSSIGVLGASLGATSSVHAAAEDPDISALVVDGAGVNDYTTIKRSWTRTTSLPQWFFPAGLLMERLLYGYDMRTLRPVDDMKKLRSRPVILIYGSREINGERQALVKDALPDAELWVVPGAAHTGAYTAVPQPYLEKVGAFYEKNLN
ncbi:MAG: CocE/NonD family hydrolase [Bryobacteraceae bacterium]